MEVRSKRATEKMRESGPRMLFTFRYAYSGMDIVAEGIIPNSIGAMPLPSAIVYVKAHAIIAEQTGRSILSLAFGFP